MPSGGLQCLAGWACSWPVSLYHGTVLPHPSGPSQDPFLSWPGAPPWGPLYSARLQIRALLEFQCGLGSALVWPPVQSVWYVLSCPIGPAPRGRQFPPPSVPSAPGYLVSGRWGVGIGAHMSGAFEAFCFDLLRYKDQKYKYLGKQFLLSLSVSQCTEGHTCLI